MVRVMLAYFTPDIVDEIRSSSMGFKLETWAQYREYHNRYNKITSKNAVDIMNEFRKICETIYTLPKASLTIGNLFRLFNKD